jgi:nucleotidyltransferase substrate binding protein (TIGR01987 family)
VESVSDSLAIFEKALATLEELASGSLDDQVVRDAAIKRFEYSWDTGWKAAREFLLREHGLDLKSPKSVIRGCMEVQLVDPDEAEQLLRIAEDRNRTVHTYDEKTALQIAARLTAHVAALRSLASAIKTAAGP